MKKIQGIVKGAMSYLKRPFILKFEESKPTVYKMQIVRGSVIKEDDIVAYAANAAHVPETTIMMAKNALFDAVNYFCSQGRRVMVPHLGSFAAVTRAKFVRNAEDCTVDTIKKHGRVLRFYPCGSVAQSGTLANINLTESKSLSNMACGVLAKEEDGAQVLVNSEGKYVVVRSTVDNKYHKITAPTGSDAWALDASGHVKPEADMVAAQRDVNPASESVFIYGNTSYTFTSGTSLAPAPGMY
jgi:nucleoid DNA-binding protein